MTAVTDFMDEVYREVRELRSQNDQVHRMLTEERARAAFRNAELATLKNTVVTEAARSAFRNSAVATLQDSLNAFAETARLKDRKTLTVPEAAKYADVEPATIRRWLSDGKLKGVKRGDQKQSQWIVRRRDLDILLERNVNQSSAIEQEHT